MYGYACSLKCLQVHSPLKCNIQYYHFMIMPKPYIDMPQRSQLGVILINTYQIVCSAVYVTSFSHPNHKNVKHIMSKLLISWFTPCCQFELIMLSCLITFSNISDFYSMSQNQGSPNKNKYLKYLPLFWIQFFTYYWPKNHWIWAFTF